MSTRSTVSSLYRRSLKLSLDWCVHRHLWRGQALYIRSLFEAQKNVHDPRLQRASSPNDALFKETEDLLQKWKHPDPYRPPTAPGGSKYERNLPSPILDQIATLTFHSSSKGGFISPRIRTNPSGMTFVKADMIGRTSTNSSDANVAGDT
ncbi:hypothetical protein BPOR_0150g00020 [Botrytis porri]|uniref:NADH dehydrogenase [ubiquinone] 1 beta subcomplex subunit 9 n=1 Tax=Botrytis porri TaxID=87229 RepID=A0A4Z1KVS0_9HELO|nr:hypothetical protein BPOR_0150g00020 [Botrytis porri]